MQVERRRRTSWRGGVLVDDPQGRTRGGGLFLRDLDGLVLDRKRFVLSFAAQDGGGCYLYRCSNFAITRSVFFLNGSKWGGAVFLESCSEGFVNGCVFIANVALRDGGALTISNCSNVHVSDNRFLGNVAFRSARNVELFTFPGKEL